MPLTKYKKFIVFFISISDCHICQAEENIDYPGDDLNDGINDSQPSLRSCVSFCRDNYPEASYYSYVDDTVIDVGSEAYNSCWCKNGNSGRKDMIGVTSGALSCEAIDTIFV